MPPLPRATLHLRILGESQHLAVDVPATPASAGDLLPAARALTDIVMDVAARHSSEQGAPPSCRKGCDACCYQLVGISAPEARALARLVEQMPAGRQLQIRGRFAETMTLVNEAAIFDIDTSEDTSAAASAAAPSMSAKIQHRDMVQRYYALHRPCPFLEDGACSIYEDRPLICRQYMVTSPADYCAQLAFDDINILEPPVKISKGLAKITAKIEGRPEEEVPLFAALAWASLPVNAAPKPNVFGSDLLKLLAKWVDAQSNLPLENRPQNP